MHGIHHFTFKLFILKDGKSSILYFLKVIERAVVQSMRQKCCLTK